MKSGAVVFAETLGHFTHFDSRSLTSNNELCTARGHSTGVSRRAHVFASVNRLTFLKEKQYDERF